MRYTKKDTAIGIMPILILGLAASFFLVLITDSARFFAPPKSDRMQAEFLLENLDAAVAEALPDETALSLSGSELCPVRHIEKATAQPVSRVTDDGRILLFPSKSRFCAKVTLEISGRNTEDGFLAFGNRRLLLGARIPLFGTRVTGEGLLLSLSPLEA
jgi:hypothetical protein